MRRLSSSLRRSVLLRAVRVIALAAVAVLAGAPQPGPASGQAAPMTRAEVRRQAEALAALGRAMFADPSLSASGRLACASCHSEADAFGPPNALAVQLAGPDMKQPGLRAVPSLKYLEAVPPFTAHFFDSPDEADESVDNGPTGGLTWDGRADRGQDQARIPLLSPFEMANADPAAVVARARAAGYGEALERIYGAAVMDSDEAAFVAIVKAFEVFEQDDRTFYPYSSKYDAYLAGTASLTAAEARGLALFDDPAKGNCASCHISGRGFDGTPPQFTDFGMIAIGVPRNPEIPANADPAYYDLGLCGPLRTDFKDRDDYCGLFRTPTLRNVALRHSFFHNGRFHTLKEVLEFYVQRDTNPERFYPRAADGSIRKFDDLPAAYQANINFDPPFDRHPGDAPALNDAEIADVIEFLRTLTDGYGMAAPDATQ
jgi:cytochrome c peroxidase